MWAAGLSVSCTFCGHLLTPVWAILNISYRILENIAFNSNKFQVKWIAIACTEKDVPVSYVKDYDGWKQRREELIYLAQETSICRVGQKNEMQADFVLLCQYTYSPIMGPPKSYNNSLNINGEVYPIYQHHPITD